MIGKLPQFQDKEEDKEQGEGEGKGVNDTPTKKGWGVSKAKENKQELPRWAVSICDRAAAEEQV